MNDAFKALASNPRRRILDYLADGPLSAGEIADKFDMAKPSISKHLALLRTAGLVSEDKQGQYVYYSLNQENLTNALYGFLSRFCPEARKIRTKRGKLSTKTGKQNE